MTLRDRILADLKHQLEVALAFLMGIINARKSSYMPPDAPKMPQDTSKSPTPTPQPRAVLNPSAPYDFSTPVAARHSLRVIADEEGLTLAQKNQMSQTLHCESGYNNDAKHPNLNLKGLVTSTDWGIAQINDHFHIGPGKDFPSVEYVLENPDKVIRWMCKMVKAGKLNLWVCFSRNMYKAYTP